MPFKPEAFDKFDALTPEQRRGAFEQMAPDQRNAFMEEYKKARAPSMLDRGLDALKNASVGAYKTVAGLNEGSTPTPGRMLAADVLAGVPVLGNVIGASGVQEDPRLGKAAVDLEPLAGSVARLNPGTYLGEKLGLIDPNETNTSAAASARFLAGLPGMLTGQGLAIGVGAKAARLLPAGAKLGAKLATVAAGDLLENASLNALGAGANAKKGERVAAALDATRATVTDPAMIAVSLLGAGLAARHVSHTLEKVDMRAPEVIAREGGEVQAQPVTREVKQLGPTRLDAPEGASLNLDLKFGEPVTEPHVHGPGEVAPARVHEFPSRSQVQRNVLGRVAEVEGMLKQERTQKNYSPERAAELLDPEQFKVGELVPESQAERAARVESQAAQMLSELRRERGVPSLERHEPLDWNAGAEGLTWRGDPDRTVAGRDMNSTAVGRDPNATVTDRDLVRTANERALRVPESTTQIETTALSPQVRAQVREHTQVLDAARTRLGVPPAPRVDPQANRGTWRVPQFEGRGPKTDVFPAAEPMVGPRELPGVPGARGKPNAAALAVYEKSTEGGKTHFHDEGVRKLVAAMAAEHGTQGTAPGGPPVDNTNPPTELTQHPQIHADAAALYAQVKRGNGAWARTVDYLKKQLSSSTGGTDIPQVASFIRGVEAAQKVQSVRFDHDYAQLERAEKALTAPERAQWGKFINDLQAGKVRDPNSLPAPLRGIFEEHVAGIRRRVDFLAKAGYLTPEQAKAYGERADKGLVWLTRDFAIYFQGKKYTPSVDAIQQAANALQKWDKKLSGNDAEARVREILDRAYAGLGPGLNPLEAKVDSKSRNEMEKIARGVLKSRTIPPEFFKLLGKIDNPNFILAMSSAELERMSLHYAATKALVESAPEGTIWSSTPPGASRPDLHPQVLMLPELSLQENRQAFGELAGKYIAKDIYEALTANATGKVDNAVFRVGNAVMNWFRTAKTAFSPQSMARNLFGNSTNLGYAGLPLWHPQFFPRFVESIRANAQFKGSTSFDKARAGGLAGRWVQFIEDGAMQPGRGADLRMGEASRVLERALEGASDFPSLLSNLGRKLNDFRGDVGAVYELMDQLPRYMAYSYQLDRGLVSGLAPLQARQRAAGIVNRYFATSANLGPAMKQLQQIPVFGPFMGWAVDNVRVHKNVMMDAARATSTGQMNPLGGEGAGPLLNGLLTYAAFAGLAKGMYSLFNVTDAEQKAGDSALSDRVKANAPVRAWLPIRDDHGNLKYMLNLDAFFPWATFLRGDPETSFATRVTHNMLKTLYDGGLVQRGVEQYTQALGDVQAQGREPYPGEQLDMLAQSAWRAMVPEVINQWQNSARRLQMPATPFSSTQPLRPGEEPFTTGEALSRYVNPLTAATLFEKVGPRAAHQQALVRGRKLEKQGKLGSRIAADASLTPEQRDKYRAANREQTLELQRRR